MNKSKIINQLFSYIKNNFQYILTCFLCLTFIFTISFYSIDPDFGWHLKAGEYIVGNGVPKYDVFTFTASNFQWINHEWLNDVLIYLTYASGGYIATSIFFSLLWLIGLLIAKRTALKFPLLLATVSLLPFIGIRPVAWTIFFVAIVERIVCSKNKRLQYLLPIIFAVWANLHGSFVLGLLILTLYQLFSSKKISWYILSISFLSVLINPYGFRIFEEIYRTGADLQLRFRISEWRPVLLPIYSIIYLIIFIPMAITTHKKFWRLLFSIPALTLALTMSSIRHFPIFTVVSLRYFEKYQKKLVSKINNSTKTKNTVRIVNVALALLWSSLVFLLVLRVRLTIYGENKYPISAINYIKNKGCDGNIFNSYNFGGYMIWKLPSYKVYIDGRMPSWQSSTNNYFNEYIEFIKNEQSREAQIKKYNIRCALISGPDLKNNDKSKKPLNKWFEEKGWTLIKAASDNKNYYLFVLNP